MTASKTVRLRVTLQFEYDADPADYPETSPKKMAELDLRAFDGDPEFLYRSMERHGGRIEVVPVKRKAGAK